MTLLLLATALLHPAWAGTCAVPIAQFSGKVDAAEQAYATFEVDAFSSSMNEAALMLPCLDAIVPSSVAAHYLRMLGLQYFVGRDSVKANAVFGAARSVDGTYEFPEALIPPGHAIRTAYAAMDLSTAPAVAIGAPRTGNLMFNGFPTDATKPTRPGWPAIVQVVDKDAAITATMLVFPSDGLPPYDAAPVPKAAVVSTAVERKPLNPKVPLAIGAGVAAIASGTLYALASGSAADFDTYRADDTVDELNARQAKTNGLVFASAGAGVLAVAGGLGAVFIGTW